MNRNLQDYIVTFDAVLEKGFCEQLIQQFENTQGRCYRGGAALSRSLADSAWSELNVSALADDSFKGFFFYK